MDNDEIRVMIKKAKKLSEKYGTTVPMVARFLEQGLNHEIEMSRMDKVNWTRSLESFFR